MDSGWTPRLTTVEENANMTLVHENGTMIIKGGLGVAVYTGVGGPPTDDLSPGCLVEVKFQYMISGGNNSGFYFAIPDGATNFEAVDSGGLEVQIATSSFNEGAQTIKDLEDKLKDAKENNGSPSLIAALENRLNQFRSRWPGGIYNKKQPEDSPRLYDSWNSMHVEMKMKDDESGMEIKVYYNGALVNTYPSDKKAPGRIGFQGHDKDGVVHIKSVEWKKTE
jgi:hypothetical protein